MYVTLILARRNLYTIYVLTAAIKRDFNYVLKNTFKEPRPDSSNRTGDYGFPSIILNCAIFFCKLIGPCIFCFEKIASFLMFFLQFMPCTRNNCWKCNNVLFKVSIWGTIHQRKSMGVLFLE